MPVSRGHPDQSQLDSAPHGPLRSQAPRLHTVRGEERRLCSQSRDRRHMTGCSSCCREAPQPSHTSGPPAHRDFKTHRNREIIPSHRCGDKVTYPRPTSLLHEGLKFRTFPVWVPKPLLCTVTHLRAENRGPREMATRTGASLCRRPSHSLGAGNKDQEISFLLSFRFLFVF